MRTASCYTQFKFGDKSVTWEGTFQRLRDRTADIPVETVQIDVAPHSIEGRLGPSDAIKSLFPRIRDGSIDAWKALKPGTEIQFRLRLGPAEGGIGLVFRQVVQNLFDAEPVKK